MLCVSTAAAQPEHTVCLNEFLAANSNVLADAQGQYDDWIELYNPGPAVVDVGGMFLTDDVDEPMQWQIPVDRPDQTTLAAGGYLLIWADGDTSDTELHANFKLSSDGEALALFDTDGATLVDRVVFGAQVGNVSMGRDPDGGPDWAFMTTPTPGASNAAPYAGVVEDVTFSVEHGFYAEPFTVTLTTATADAQIWYTLDGTTPHGDAHEASAALRYDQPISVDGTTVIRAVATKPGWKDAPLTACTYVFAADVQQQLYPPLEPNPGQETRAPVQIRPGVPTPPEIPEEPVAEEPDPALEAALGALPSVCLVIEPNDFFDAQTGINANPMGRGIEWERPVSVEWIDPNGRLSFQVNAGLRIHGGVSRSSGIKHSLRLIFRAQYGRATLDAPLFADTDVTHFDSLVLRGTLHDSWSWGTDQNAQYLRDQFSRDTMRDLGRLTPYGRPVHVYINERYWGLYILVERPDDGFAAAHLGGSKADYDALKARSVSDPDPSPIEIVAGDLTAWNALFELAAAGLDDQARYDLACEYVDVESLIDYMLMVFYIGSTDGPVGPRNFWVVRPREDGGGFVFLAWDLEFSLRPDFLTVNRVTATGVDNPHLLFHRLAENADFRMHVADRVYTSFFCDGPLTPERATERYLDRASGVERAVLAEAARWSAAGEPSEAERLVNAWKNARDRLITTYFPARTDIVVGQLRNADIYPPIEPVRPVIDGLEQRGGRTYSGALLTLANPNAGGTVYYTTDGTDPRLFGQVPDVNELVTLIEAHAPKHVLVPTEDIGDDWTGAAEPYDDTNWTAGTPAASDGGGAVGYVEARFNDLRISYDVGDTMPWHLSCCIRIPFEVRAEDLPDLSHLALKVQCDDGFVAYLNGVEVAALNKPEPLTWDARCTNRSDSWEHVWMSVPGGSDLLRAGSNILAVRAFDHKSDDLFLFAVEVFASDRAFIAGQVAASAQLRSEPILLTGTQRIKARVWHDGLWSPLSDAVFAVGPVRENLRITEIMYHPSESEAEFIELANVGTETLDLNMVHLAGGIDFVFPSLPLAPLDVILVVRDRDAFERRYGPGLNVAGQYEGALGNASDRIELLDALGQVIQTIQYDDDWYPQTDGQGYSLTCRDPFALDPNASSDSTVWQPSLHTGGSPGVLAEP